jgi:hypothetical protein
MLEDKDDEILELMQEVDKLQHEKSSHAENKADNVFVGLTATKILAQNNQVANDKSKEAPLL